MNILIFARLSGFIEEKWVGQPGEQKRYNRPAKFSVTLDP